MSPIEEEAGKRSRKSPLKKNLNLSGEPIDPTTLRGETVVDLVTAVMAAGGAVRIGATRDGGAWCIAVYMDGECKTGYCPATTDVNDWLIEIISQVQG